MVGLALAMLAMLPAGSGSPLQPELVNAVFANDSEVGYCYIHDRSHSRESFIRNSYDIEPLNLRTGQHVVVLSAQTACLCGAQNCPVSAYVQHGNQFQLALSSPAIESHFDKNGTAVILSHDSAAVSLRETYVFDSMRYKRVKSDVVDTDTGKAKPLQALQSWNDARPGVKAFVDAEEGDVPEASICPTLAVYQHHLRENDPKGCKSTRSGTPVTVSAITRAHGDFGLYGQDLRVAAVRAAQGSITGYIALELLNPVVPIGTDVTLKHQVGDIALRLAPLQRDGSDIGLMMATGTRARVVSYNPRADGAHDLQVRITSGRNAGRTGWVYARMAFLSDGTAILRFKL